MSLAAESESIDSENWLFGCKLQEYKDKIPNLISRRQFNDRRKTTMGLCEEIRKRLAMEMDGAEELFTWDTSKIPTNEQYTPQVGDTRVWQPYPGQRPQAGHIDWYNGTNWVSDFKQRGIWYLGFKYETFHVKYKTYR